MHNIMREELISHLENYGYMVRYFSREEFTLLYMPEAECVNAVLLIDNCEGVIANKNSIGTLKEQIRNLFAEKSVHIMMLVLTDNAENDKDLLVENPFCWLINVAERRLLIYEKQVVDFYGLKGNIEGFLNGDFRGDLSGSFKEDISTYTVIKNTGRKRNIPYITYGLLLVNVIIFLVCTGTGNLLYNTGMLYGPYVFDKGEVYRLITCMFLHSGMSHLTSNMLVLFALGEMLEREMGHVKFLILYFVAGIGGGLASIGYGYYSDNIVSSIGASGAVFGMVGALLLLVIIHKGQFKTISLPRLIFAIIVLIYEGLIVENIDNAAHIGGLITGFLIMTVLTLVSGKVRGRK